MCSWDSQVPQEDALRTAPELPCVVSQKLGEAKESRTEDKRLTPDGLQVMMAMWIARVTMSALRRVPV